MDTVYTEDISYMTIGKSYSIEINFEEEDGYIFTIDFKPGLNYSIFIHDPYFYVLSSNPGTFPHILLRMDDTQTQEIYLKTT